MTESLEPEQQGERQAHQIRQQEREAGRQSTAISKGKSISYSDCFKKEP